MLKGSRTNTIYLDHGATTPLDPAVAAAMQPYWSDLYGNPSSLHTTGRVAARAVEDARETYAEWLGARPREIVFTGCGSESNNMALRGVMWAAMSSGIRGHLITSAVEHNAVGATALQLRDVFGFEVTILPVDGEGLISVDDVAAAIRPDTVLISVMAAQNEIGTIQPWREIGELARSCGVVFHTDAVQLVAGRRWDLANEPVDLLTIAPHKFYGPKGVGVLYVREGVEMLSTLTGGGQEDGRRAGTLNVPLIVGAAAAFRLAQETREERLAHFLPLRERLITGVLESLPDVAILTGHRTQRLSHHASFAFRGLSGNDLLMHLDLAGIAASSGSACSSGNPKPSAVLQALGLGPEWTKSGLRLTIGLQNTAEQIDRTVEALARAVQKLEVMGQAIPA